MYKKVYVRSMVCQCVLIVLILLVVYLLSICFGYRQLVDNINDNLEQAKSVEFFEPKSFMAYKSSKYSYTKDVTAILCYEDGKYRSANTLFCAEEVFIAIAKSAQTKTEGRIKTSDHYYYAFQAEKFKYSEDLTIVYIYDFTDNYKLFCSNIVMLTMVTLIGATLVLVIVIVFNKRNLLPFKSSFESHKQLVANASHELKTPITILTTHLSILQEDIEMIPEEDRGWVNGMKEQVDRMSHLVNEMLELARFESIRHTESYKSFDYSEMVNRVTLASEVLAFEKNILFESRIVPNIMLFADPDGMEKAVYTLIENAIKYTPENGKITITLLSDNRRAVLKIRNTGIGIKREDMPNLFDRFYRGDKAHPSTNNFGLGLAIAKAIVDANKGTIGVDSVENRFTEFVIIMKEKNVKNVKKKKQNLLWEKIWKRKN